MKKLIVIGFLLAVVVLYAFTKTFPQPEHSEITFPVTEE